MPYRNFMEALYTLNSPPGISFKRLRVQVPGSKDRGSKGREILRAV